MVARDMTETADVAQPPLGFSNPELLQESCLDATEALEMAARELSETAEVTSATAAGPLEVAAQACGESADVAQPPLMCSK